MRTVSASTANVEGINMDWLGLALFVNVVGAFFYGVISRISQMTKLKEAGEWLVAILLTLAVILSVSLSIQYMVEHEVSHQLQQWNLHGIADFKGK